MLRHEDLLKYFETNEELNRLRKILKRNWPDGTDITKISRKTEHYEKKFNEIRKILVRRVR